jgi:hypothetical protein
VSICIYCGQDHPPGLRLCPKTGKALGNGAQTSNKTLFGVAPPPVVPGKPPADSGRKLTPIAVSLPPPKPAPTPAAALAKTMFGTVPAPSTGSPPKPIVSPAKPVAAPARPPVASPAPAAPRLPTAQEARDNPDLVISLDVTPPAGYPVKATPALRPARPATESPMPRQPASPAPPAREARKDAPPVDLSLDLDFSAVGPPPARERPPTVEAPVDLPPAATGRRLPTVEVPVDLPPAGAGHRFMLPQPIDETVRRTPVESSRIGRDARLVLELTRWAAGNYLRNPKQLLLLTAFLVLPASVMQSCLLAATVAVPETTATTKLGATVDFSGRKADLAKKIQQAQTRGMVDNKAVAELAALNSVENTVVPLPTTKEPAGKGWFRARLASLIQGFLLLGLALPLALAALGLATVDQHGGAALPGLSDVWAVLVARAELVLVSLLPAALLVALGHALFVLPGLVLNLLFIFLPHVVLFERRSGRDALERSLDLVRTDARRAILAFLLFGAVGFLAATLAELVFPPSGSRAVVFVHYLLADGLAMLVFPIPALVLARLYIDIRARTGALAERLSRAARS